MESDEIRWTGYDKLWHTASDTVSVRFSLQVTQVTHSPWASGTPCLCVDAYFTGLDMLDMLDMLGMLDIHSIHHISESPRFSESAVLLGEHSSVST